MFFSSFFFKWTFCEVYFFLNFLSDYNDFEKNALILSENKEILFLKLDIQVQYYYLETKIVEKKIT